MGSEDAARRIGVFFMASRAKGLSLMLKDSELKAKPGQSLDASLTIGDTPVTELSARVLSSDEIGVFPRHGLALAAAAAADKADRFAFKSPLMSFESRSPAPSPGSAPAPSRWSRRGNSGHGARVSAPFVKMSEVKSRTAELKGNRWVTPSSEP